MRSLAFTSNGPGEFSGWVRPLIAALYEREPDLDVTAFFIPDDYASGGEPDAMRALFPAARVVTPKEYLKFAVGGSLPQAPAHVDAVVYLGGDLLHAAAVHRRLGGRPFSYKFAGKRYGGGATIALAVDAANRAQLRAQHIADERIHVVGNLAIDGALAEARGAFGAASGDMDVARDGILIMPGSRKHEIAQLIPFFTAVADHLRRRAPGMPIAFGLSPFNRDAEIAAALAAGGDPRVYGARGALRDVDGRLCIVSERSGGFYPVVRLGMRAATQARLVITIPGTKCIELAALGVPIVACTPLNVPEKIAINGPLTYLDRLPMIGVPLKRAVVRGFARRFPLLTQPNIDAGEAIISELRGTLTPGRVAAAAAERFEDRAWLAQTSARLRGLYSAHAGAARRAADAILEHA